jgi:hypothetical protein
VQYGRRLAQLSISDPAQVLPRDVLKAQVTRVLDKWFKRSDRYKGAQSHRGPQEVEQPMSRPGGDSGPEGEPV